MVRDRSITVINNGRCREFPERKLMGMALQLSLIRKDPESWPEEASEISRRASLEETTHHGECEVSTKGREP